MALSYRYCRGMRSQTEFGNEFFEERRPQTPFGRAFINQKVPRFGSDLEVAFRPIHLSPTAARSRAANNR